MHIIPIGGDEIIHEVTNRFLKKRITVILTLDFKNIKQEDLVTLTDVEPINPNAFMTILPGGTRNVLLRSLGLSTDFDECCKKLLRFDNFQNVDVIAAIVISSK
ncbi:hypothetical protein BH23THE1_BH23THE1_01140 [soil metagenome]